MKIKVKREVWALHNNKKNWKKVLFGNYKYKNKIVDDKQSIKIKFEIGVLPAIAVLGFIFALLKKKK